MEEKPNPEDLDSEHKGTTLASEESETEALSAPSKGPPSFEI